MSVSKDDPELDRLVAEHEARWREQAKK